MCEWSGSWEFKGMSVCEWSGSSEFKGMFVCEWSGRWECNGTLFVCVCGVGVRSVRVCLCE